MRPGPLVDALIEHLVDDLGRYALENSFHGVVEGAVLARADPRARDGLQLGDRQGQPGRVTKGGGAGPLAPGTTVVPRQPRASLPTGQPDDRPGRPGTPREG
ncbi:hypothetical protein GCM10022233_87600 [Streptomyces shaanxiensis]|uniref:Uncharacterized protein n=1 Tax=Streptomyces shaanxiensis TaxID=653357 RepID=A0ABP7WM74_9ACTN